MPTPMSKTSDATLPLDAPACRWCGEPAVDLANAECQRCGVLRPTSGPDADLLVACDRCGNLGADMLTGLCQGCDR
jgi:ribosomal protein L37E